MNSSRESIINDPYWDIFLTEDQTYLGRCVLVLKRQCGDLAEITQEELLSFHGLVKKLQSAAKQAFGATMFNWACLMNNAYREADPKPQVHWHLRPRYRNPVTFLGETFNDPDFGEHYTPEILTTTPRILSPELMHSVVEAYQKFLN